MKRLLILINIDIFVKNMFFSYIGFILIIVNSYLEDDMVVSYLLVLVLYFHCLLLV